MVGQQADTECNGSLHSVIGQQADTECNGSLHSVVGQQADTDSGWKKKILI